jgi:hypothetical protein
MPHGIKNEPKEESTVANTIQLKASDLVLGDQVKLFDGAYGWGTVVKATEDVVEIFRVYVHIGDFKYSGGVLHYTGHEMVRVFPGGDRTFKIQKENHERMKKEGALK